MFLLGAIAIAIYGVASRGNAVSHSAEVASLVASAFFALFFLGCAYVLYRLVFPPGARGLRVALATPETRRGSHVDVTLELKGGRGGTVELGLVCTEYYDVEKTSSNGAPQRVTTFATAHEEWRPPTGRAERFEVPADAPFSYRGDCVSYVWRVSAREPRRRRFDRAVNLPLTVRP